MLDGAIPGISCSCALMPVKEVGALAGPLSESLRCGGRTCCRTKQVVFSLYPHLGSQRPLVWMQSLEKAEDTTTDDAPMWVKNGEFPVVPRSMLNLSRWKKLRKEKGRHFSILASRTLVKSAGRVCGTRFGRRTRRLFLVDNLSCCIASDRSRSASNKILGQLRR